MFVSSIRPFGYNNTVDFLGKHKKKPDKRQKAVDKYYQNQIDSFDITDMNISSDEYIFLHKDANHDSLMFMNKHGRGKQMSLYSVCTNKEYTPKNEVEIAFDSIIKKFMIMDENKDKPLDEADYDVFRKAYEDLYYEISYSDEDKTDATIYLLCSLIECIDNPKTSYVASFVREHLFDHFLPSFEYNEVVKNTIRKIVSSNVLKRDVVRAVLRDYE